ncbi:hypothetical protein OSB04_011530 [Centaurea solstitialis]|uniref:Uncharacterized protein n=1 Tax=Centaurea solstitialis TaxID=347529 RepID=A0AA38TKB6_9ASTR|nr:hypothetical protein OSB04_011530 [Centaurea solstitialis]
MERMGDFDGDNPSLTSLYKSQTQFYLGMGRNIAFLGLFEAGMISSYENLISLSVYALIDTWVMHSIVSDLLETQLKPYKQTIDSQCVISTPMGGTICVLNGFFFKLSDCSWEATLLPMHMSYLDLILGIDRLSHHGAKIECRAKQIVFGEFDKPETIFREEDDNTLASTLTRYTCRNTKYFLASLQNFQTEFTIILVLGASSISEAPNRTAPNEMKELITQLDDLLKKSFIRAPSL